MNCLPMRVNERYRKPHLNFRHNFAKDMATHRNRCFKICWGHWRHIAAFFVIVWVIITYLIISPLSKNDRSEKAFRLKLIEEKYNALRKNHDKMVADYAPSTTGRVRSKVPPKEYELFRHRAYAEIVALFEYLDSEIKDMAENPAGRSRLLAIRNLTEERKASLLTDLDCMSQSDGYAEWRQRTATATSDLLQRRLHRLQNPRDCDAARKLICEIDENCDFGCRIFKLEYCMTFAYATERTVIVNYLKLESSQQIQVSDTCLTCSNCKRVEPYDEEYDESMKVVYFKSNLYSEERFKFLPLTVPEDLAPLVTRFNGDPSSWWIGQMLKYILKPRPDLQRTINETIAKLDFKNPIVGIHYHRSNKMLSRGFHPSIQQYMDPVRQYYDQLELRSQSVQRRVYLATDDDYILKKARQYYPNYIFISSSDTSLAGLLADVTLLARTDYLVCTFSSQVSRLAYELMQARVDASKRVFSLDDSYYFGDLSRRV